jgi:hypothetical protein
MAGDCRSRLHVLPPLCCSKARVELPGTGTPEATLPGSGKFCVRGRCTAGRECMPCSTARLVWREMCKRACSWTPLNHQRLFHALWLQQLQSVVGRAVWRPHSAPEQRERRFHRPLGEPGGKKGDHWHRPNGSRMTLPPETVLESADGSLEVDEWED